MSSEVAITLRNVCKIYPIYTKPHDPLLRQFYNGLGKLPLLPNSLKEHFNLKAKNCRREFCALRDVSFEIRRGESVAIIGRNGSGKSTLLQIIAGTLTPTQGEVSVNGCVAALLELGSGFNAEFTGRENVYLNGSLLGMTKRQIEERFDEIAAFADIGEFLDQPVKTYSSGMMVRLAFAVQTVIEPDILIIDEALSVGDFFFQQKCAKRMNQLRDNGTTLLFVSHDMGAVRDLCQQAGYLRQGELVYYGHCHQAIKLYFMEGTAPSTRANVSNDLGTDVAPSECVQTFKQLACWMNDSAAALDGQHASILGVALLDANGRPTMKIIMGRELTFWVLIQQYSELPMDLVLIIKNRYDQVVSSVGTYTLGIELPSQRSGSYSLFELKMKAVIEAGLYTFRAVLGHIGMMPNRGSSEEKTPWLGPFSISWDYEKDRAPFLGMFGVPVEGRFLEIKEVL